MVGEESDETAEKCDEMERESERQPESERASVVCTSNPSVVWRSRREKKRRREKGKEGGKEEEEEEGRRDTVQRKQE